MTIDNSAQDEQTNPHSKTVTGVILVMGVSGCGKSTVAERVADALTLPFVEADSLHPASNIQKMSSGTPLTDQDRQPWLEQVRDECRLLSSTHDGCVVACSALKKRYRQTLSDAHPTMSIVFLYGEFSTIHSRMSARSGHFMPDTLLRSQFDALEDPRGEPGVVAVNIDQTLTELIDQTLDGLEKLS